jgi:hypothetical protein
MSVKWGKKRKEEGGVSAQSGADKPARTSNRLDHVLVKEDNTRPPGRLKALLYAVVKHPRFKPVAAILLVALVITNVLFFLVLDRGPGISDGPKCSQAMLEKAKPAFDTAKVVELEPQAQEIEKIAGYDQDVNCLYVVLTYYINTSDGTKARQLHTTLKEVYDPNKGYQTVLWDVAQTPEELEPTVAFLENQAKNQDIDAAGGMKGVTQ